jgi:glycosyltransferase involved in cell wall biosynthesis
MRICRVATVPFFVLHHLRSQLLDLAQAGHEVIVVASPEAGADDVARLPGVRFCPADIARPIAPARDAAALWRLYRLFRQLRPDIVHSTTPKAGLLCAIAAWLARVPVRLHTFTGQAWAELSGPVRWIAQASDWLIVRLNTRCYADSASQRAFLVERGLAPADRLAVLGSGSLAGVDLALFDPERLRHGTGATRARLGLAPHARVITFIGRVTRDKGVVELVRAFTELRQRFPDLHLVVVGPPEPERDPVPAEILQQLRSDTHIHLIGYDPSPEQYLALASVLCLPSYREGFGNVVIEAAALGVPAVGTLITGLSDAIVDGQTGVLVPAKDSEALAKALATVLENEVLRRGLGEAARSRAVAEFDSRVVNGNLMREYVTLMQAVSRQAGR